MRTEDSLSFYERYLAIRERVETRMLEQGMVQTFAPPASTPANSPRRGHRRRVAVAGRRAHQAQPAQQAQQAHRRGGPAGTAPAARPARPRCQLALDLV